MNHIEPQTFRSGKVYLIDRDIIHILYDKDLRLEIEDLLVIRDFRVRAIGKKPFYSVLDMRSSLAKASNEAKVWAAVNKESSDLRIMDVFVVKNLVMRLRVGAYLKLFKPKTKTKMVTSLDAALELIAKHRDKSA